MLRDVLGPEIGGALRKATFMPAMYCARASLPYQYSLYVNYEPTSGSALAEWNDEVPDEFRASNAIRMPDEAPKQRTHDEAPVGGTKLSFEALLERELAKERASGTSAGASG